MPSCIAGAPTSDVLVLCHENPSKCSFSSAFQIFLIFLVFTRFQLIFQQYIGHLSFVWTMIICPQSVRFLLYIHDRRSHLTLLSASGHQPCMVTLLSTFLLESPNLSGPYFAGYCGEHVVNFPDTTQLSRRIRIEESEISAPQGISTHFWLHRLLSVWTVISWVIYGPESFVRLSTSALVGYPDPDPWIFRAPGALPVRATVRSGVGASCKYNI